MKYDDRPMRKAAQHRWNKDLQQHEIYYIDVPVELEKWEIAGLELQFERRRKRAAKKIKNEGTDARQN